MRNNIGNFALLILGDCVQCHTKQVLGIHILAMMVHKLNHMRNIMRGLSHVCFEILMVYGPTFSCGFIILKMSYEC